MHASVCVRVWAGKNETKKKADHYNIRSVLLIPLPSIRPTNNNYIAFLLLFTSDLRAPARAGLFFLLSMNSCNYERIYYIHIYKHIIRISAPLQYCSV